MGTLKDYFNKGIQPEIYHMQSCHSTLSADLHATMELYKKLDYKLTQEDQGLETTVKLTNQNMLYSLHVYIREVLMLILMH